MGSTADSAKMSLWDVLYPPICSSCKILLRENTPFCSFCLENLHLLPKEGHCMKCFREISERKGTCKDCRQKRSPFRKLATCFDSFGTGKTLLEKYKKYRSNEKDLAAFIVLQLEALEFAPFEVIVDVPSYFSSPFRMIAKEVAKMLCLIRVPILKRSLTPRPHFSLKKKCSIINKKVLLLSSEMHSREEVQAAGWALKEGRPEVIDGMTFCATLH